MGVIVSFTSYPPRIDRVHMVVESLYQQTVQADEIILYLSLEEFPKAEGELPDNLRVLIGKRKFRIEWVEGNLKSHKKYYYALQKYRQDIVITVDDDTVYAESMISDLVKVCRRYPHAISARRVRMIFKGGNGLENYRNWDGNLDEYADIPRMDICAIGVGGICYPPGTGSEKWFRKEEMTEVAGHQDDLWLKYNEIRDHIPVVYALPSNKDIQIDYAEEDRLFDSNLNGGNDRCADALLKRLKIEYSARYEDWFQNLMFREEYVKHKKRYYSNILKADLDKAKGLPVYLYGAGKMATYLLDVLSDLYLADEITAVIVSDKECNPAEVAGIEVRQVDEIDRGKLFGIIFGVNASNRRQIENTLNGFSYCSIELNMQAITRYSNIISGWQHSSVLYGSKEGQGLESGRRNCRK